MASQGPKKTITLNDITLLYLYDLTWNYNADPPNNEMIIALINKTIVNLHEELENKINIYKKQQKQLLEKKQLLENAQLLANAQGKEGKRGKQGQRGQRGGKSNTRRIITENQIIKNKSKKNQHKSNTGINS